MRDSLLLDEARRLVPTIRAARAESERERQLAPSVLAAMHRARLFRMLVPADVDGLQVDLATAMRVVETIAAADGAAGWNLMIGATYGLWASRFPREIAREIWGAADAVVAGALRPTGTARAVDGGFIVDGRWSFASGIQHSGWWLGGCIVHDGETPRQAAGGAPELRVAFFPATDGELIDTWEVGGLRGTGSHDYAVKNLRVPAARVVTLDTPSRLPDVLYRLPLMVLFDSTMAAVPLGIARTAIDSFVELAGGKRSHGFAAAPAARPIIQADVGRAEALLHAARAWLYGSVEEVTADVAAGRDIPVRQTALLRLARANAMSASLQAVDLMYSAAAGSAIYATSLLERCFRDVHVVAQHVALHPSNYETCGRIMLGLPSDRPFL